MNRSDLKRQLVGLRTAVNEASDRMGNHEKTAFDWIGFDDLDKDEQDLLITNLLIAVGRPEDPVAAAAWDKIAVGGRSVDDLTDAEADALRVWAES